jgi:hypothetical protein
MKAIRILVTGQTERPRGHLDERLMLRQYPANGL